MKFFGNSFEGIREIQGFDKDGLIEIKRTLFKFKSEEKEEAVIEEYLKSLFNEAALERMGEYVGIIRRFCEKYLFPKENLELEDLSLFFHLKTKILEELTQFSRNFISTKSNIRNVKRFIKESVYLETLTEKVSPNIEDYAELISELEKQIEEPKNIFENDIYIWVEINKISNLLYEYQEISMDMGIWDEFKEIDKYVKQLDPDTAKKIKKKKEMILKFQFNSLFQYYTKRQDGLIDYYAELLYFFFINKHFMINTEEYFVSVLDKKVLLDKLYRFIRPILREAIEVILKEVIDELLNLDKQYQLHEEGKVLKPYLLIEEDVSVGLSQIVDYYFKGIERKYQEIINKTDDPIEYRNIITFYSEKAEILYALIQAIEEIVLNIESLLSPHNEIIAPMKKTTTNLLSEILRREEEYIFYLKTVKNERVIDNLRSFVNDKVSEINKILEKYQDETSLIVREEFPQLKKIRGILKDYHNQIDSVKSEVYKKLEAFQAKKVDTYQVIKVWEDNLNKKKQQLSFMLSLLLHKIYKNFKELIEQETILFDSLTELKEQEKIMEQLPLNFAISRFIADKLSEEELLERIGEIKTRIKQLKDEIKLYEDEITQLKDIKASRVRLREGIEKAEVQCSVCHKYIDFANEKIIKCPFCENVFHYLCVAFWLSKYNACPVCNNQFLDPNSGMFEHIHD
ncbi:MAG: hypothetical protein ACTSR8_17795 [Promethearchaeota archaeon]